MREGAGWWLATAVLVAAFGCVHTEPPEAPELGPPPAASGAAAGAPTAAAADQRQAEDSGALDAYNRGIRTFNFWLLDYLFHPVARGWNVIMPKWGQRRFRNLFENLERPRDIVNSLLQAKPGRAGRHLGSFLVDTTVGLAGMFPISEYVFEFESPETFNETLGAWGVPPGAYIILPVLGETSPRGIAATPVDVVLNPLFWVSWALLGGTTGTVVGGARFGVQGANLLALQMPGPFAPDEQWDAYFELLHTRNSYPEAKELFFENQQLDVED